MKKYLIFSDIHGSASSLLKLKHLMTEFDGALFAGDGIGKLSDFTEKEFYRVGGNCDFSGADELTLELDGVRILLTHGHIYGVKYRFDALVQRAKELDCTVAVFGHTHKPLVTVRDDVLLVNPGSCKGGYDSSTYAVLIISDGKTGAMINELTV